MDIHRCRFVPFPSSAVNALSFSHTTNTSSKTKTQAPATLRLALGRANGDIEIWNPSNGQWVQESIIRGGKDRSIEALAWIEDPQDVDKHGRRIPGKLRLFSIGYSEVVTEWDLAAGKPLKNSAGEHGEIWCMASQPKDVLPEKLASRPEDEQRDLEAQAQKQCIALGCVDGSIVIMSPTDEGLQFEKVLARPGKRKTRVLSVTFQNRHTIVAGHADSTIRIYDLRAGTPPRTMTLGAGPKDGPSETLVWAVKCLKDGTIVSGDSNGEVKFWDGKIYALTQRIKGHEADILDIGIAADGRTVFSGGIDRRTCTYQRVTNKDSGGPRTRWVKSSHVRIHRNDVKAMASYESKNMSVLASGGLDASLSVVPILKSHEEYYRTLSGLPQRSPVVSAPSKRLMVSWWDREIRIWRITSKSMLDNTMDPSDIDLDTSGRKIMAKILLQGDETITAVDISPDGQLLAASTMAETKFFRLQIQDQAMKVRRLAVPETYGQLGAKLVHFAPNGRWLVLVSSSNVTSIIRIKPSLKHQGKFEAHPRILKLSRFRRSISTSDSHHGTSGKHMQSINHAAFSSDSRILAVCDLSGFIDSFLLEGVEDLGDTQVLSDSGSSSNTDSGSDSESGSNDATPHTVLGQRWIRNPAGNLIPRLHKVPTVLSFRPAVATTSKPLTNGINEFHHSIPPTEDRLIAITSDNFLAEYHVLTGNLSAWSRRNPIKVFPNDYRILRDPAKGLIWDAHTPSRNRIWVYGISWLWMFDLSQDFPIAEHLDNQSTTASSATLPHNSKSQRQNQGEMDQLTALKRKREKGTGAGGTRKAVELNSGLGSTVEQIDGAGPVRDRQTIDVSSSPRKTERSNERDEPSDTDSDVGYSYPLLLQRRKAAASTVNGAAESKQPQQNNEDENDDAMDIDPPTTVLGSEIEPKDQVNGHTALSNRRRKALRRGALEEQLQQQKKKEKKGPMTWHSFKYRPILGIVPIGEPASAGDGGSGVEVAVVERPEWEADKDEGVGRFVGGQEWDP